MSRITTEVTSQFTTDAASETLPVWPVGSMQVYCANLFRMRSIKSLKEYFSLSIRVWGSYEVNLESVRVYWPTTSQNSDKDSAGMSSSWKARSTRSEASKMGMSLWRTYSASEKDQPPSVLLVATFCTAKVKKRREKWRQHFAVHRQQRNDQHRLVLSSHSTQTKTRVESRILSELC